MKAIDEIGVTHLSRNFPDWYWNTNQDKVTVIVQDVNEDDILTEEYFAINGKIEVSLADYFDSILSIEIPPTSVYQYPQITGRGYFKIIINDFVNPPDEYGFFLTKGGVDTDLTDEDFLIGNFLTFQPQEKWVKPADVEFLSYFSCFEILILKVKGIGNLVETKTLYTMHTIYRLYTMNVSLPKLQSLFTYNCGVFELWVENPQGVRQTWVQRFVRYTDYDRFDDSFYFVNSLGGVDHIRLTDEKKLKPDHTINNAVFGKEKRDYSVDWRNVYEKKSGNIDSAAGVLFAQEFLASPVRWIRSVNKYLPISVQSQNAEFTLLQLNEFSFEYQFSADLENKRQLVRGELDDFNYIDFNADFGNDFLIDTEGEGTTLSDGFYKVAGGVITLAVEGTDYYSVAAYEQVAADLEAAELSLEALLIEYRQLENQYIDLQAAYVALQEELYLNL